MKQSPLLRSVSALVTTAALVSSAWQAAHAAASYSDVIQSQGPSAYYRFNDGQTVAKIDTAVNLGSLGSVANGIYNGAQHPVVGGLSASGNTATSVVGGSHVAIPRVAELNPDGPWTVEGWFKPGVAFTDGTLTCAISSGDFVAPRAGWLIYQSSAGFNLRLYNQNGTATSANISSALTISPGAWYHVAAVYDGSDAVLYVNGAEVARQAGVAYVAGQKGPFTLGMRADVGFGWNGSIDEVAYYSGALPAEKILAHYQAGVAAAPTTAYNEVVLADAPLGYWRLDEGAFIPPVAANSGSKGTTLNGAYRGAAVNGTEAPKSPAFIGFEDGNTSLELDGASAYVSTLAGLLNGKSKFTVSSWIRRAADQGTRTGIWGQNDLFEFGYIDNDTLQAWTDGNLDLRPNPFPNEEWGHIAVVVDGGTISTYTNGVLAVSRTHSLPADNNFSFNVGGGGVFDGSGNFFRGQIDEVAFFERALTGADLCNQYAAAVPKAPEVVAALEPVTVYAGSTATVSSLVCGTPDLQYQWYRSGGAIVAGATGSSLVLANAQVSDTGDYYVRVTNPYGSVDSDPVTVTVLAASAPIVDVPPASVTRYAGLNVTLGLSVSGTPPFTYQWQKNEAPIVGATNASLVLSNLVPASAGSYRVVVKNPIGEATSAAATVAVLVPASGSYEAAVVATKPDAYWRLGETEGSVAFDYAGGLDGTYNNVTQGAEGGLAGDSNTSAEFVGGDSSVTTTASLNNLTAFTLTGWIRRNGTQPNRTGLFGQNDVIEFGFIDDQTIESYFASGDAIDVANPIPDETWAFVVVRGNSSQASIQVNGATIGLITGSFGAYGSSTYKLNIGGGGVFDATGNGFLGRIDEVTFHSRALSDEELCGLLLAGTGAPFDVTLATPGAFVEDVHPGTPTHEATLLGATIEADDAVHRGVLVFRQAEGDQATIPASPVFNSSRGTISFWVKTAGVTGGGNEGAILFDRRTSSGDVIVIKDDGTLFVQASGGSGIVNSFSTTTSVADGVWHHVAYVYDQSATGTTTLYVDGTLAGSKTSSAAWTWPAAQPIELGRSHDAYWKKLDGSLDDFRIYNTTLSDGEISAIAAGDSANLVQASALVVRYDFDSPAVGYTLTWTCGILQSTEAFNADGSAIWTDIAGATSPYPVRAASGQRFYRVRR